eukprot:CAMPEP_0116881228 /NCGR_PEP_ID=MMETSP0463-20121206/13324_1 /TAXON_ID=181622 /ORGANISM="Strombidinopsis sp, Strain SopsisLIS2011" /LENGTH=73 /DNA_ID=CAMNT_0004532931 /DNA_START=160 /DNA_END=382 /DNA_ORIENTATION=+
MEETVHQITSTYSTKRNEDDMEEKTDAKKKAKALQDRVKEMREKRRDSKQAIANRKKEKAKQKKINEMRSASY